MAITFENSRVRRALFVALGVLCVVIGVAGVFLPGVPTTEFITSGIGIQLLVLTTGLVGTATILFVVRTTAERQPLILS